MSATFRTTTERTTNFIQGRGRGRGGGRGGRGGRGRGGGNRGGGGGYHNAPRQSFEEVNKHNEHMEKYYNELNLVPEGEEREQFWAALRRELPNSFRFCGSKGSVILTRLYRPSTNISSAMPFPCKRTLQTDSSLRLQLSSSTMPWSRPRSHYRGTRTSSHGR